MADKKHKLVRIEAELYERLAELASRDARSITQYINLTLVKALEQRFDNE